MIDQTETDHFARKRSQTLLHCGYIDANMARNTATDARTDNQKIKMATWFDEERAEYEDADGFEIAFEDDECAIVVDHTGHEINEWANRFDVDREQLRATFRDLAEQKMGEWEAHEAFSHADPVVFDKLED